MQFLLQHALKGKNQRRGCWQGHQRTCNLQLLLRIGALLIYRWERRELGELQLRVHEQNT